MTGSRAYHRKITLHYIFFLFLFFFFLSFVHCTNCLVTVVLVCILLLSRITLRVQASLFSMIYLVDFIYSFSLYVSIYIFLFLILASRILFRVSSCVYECVQCEFVHVYRKSKHPYWKKKIYSVLTCSSWFFLHPPSLLPCFFSVLRQWLMISYERKSLFFFGKREK